MAVVISSMHESMQYIGSLFIMLWATTQTNYLDLWEIKWISFTVQHISTYLVHIYISTLILNWSGGQLRAAEML